MSKIVRAEVVTNSSEDKFARVKLHNESLWQESPLTCSVGGIPLKKGDYVFVDISAGTHNPIILGRSTGEFNEYSTDVKGSLLFESSDGSDWAISFVKNNEVTIQTSDGTTIKLDGKAVSVEASKVVVSAKTVEMKGAAVSDPIGGPFNCIKVCPFTGVIHSGWKVNG